MLDKLRRDGIATHPDRLDGGAIAAHLEQAVVYNAHVQAKSNASVIFSAAVRHRQWPTFCHAMVDAVTAPGLFEMALSIYPLVRDYFEGERPLLYSMNAFWTQPAPGQPQYQDTHSWHRDEDDRRQLVAFCFGTDVNEERDGAHYYQRGSHLRGDGDLGYDFRFPPGDRIETVIGPAGTVFLTDTRGVHMGLRPARPRCLLWARWGVSDPPASYGWDKLSPVPRALLGDRYPTDPTLQDAVRLVVA